MERTLGILKPDCLQRKFMGRVINHLEEEGFTIINGMIKHLTRKEAEGFYSVHKDRPFFDDLIEFMMSGPVFIMLLERENGIVKLREVIGATDPAQATPGTIRKKWAESIQNNLIHASDSHENASFEIKYFFPDVSIYGSK